METQERILAKADIRMESKNKKRQIIAYILIIAIVTVIGLMLGCYSHNVSSSYVCEYGWFDFRFYRYHNHATSMPVYTQILFDAETWYYNEGIYVGNIILVSAIYILLIGFPIAVSQIRKRQCKNTALTISESKVYGSYNSFLFKKSLEMPIEKIDNLTTISGLMDKLRTGVTLGVCSASGVIKIHFVQNAEEVISAAMNRIDEIKEKEKRSRVVAQATANAHASTSDKLKDLLAMKESGLITEEEYTKKREEILSNM